MEEFWDFKSKNYPTPFDEYGLVTPTKVISKVKDFGVDFRSKRVLDIGCGTGLYSSIIAKEAEHIVGVDLSSGMLGRFKEYIHINDLKNIELLQSDFKAFDTQEQYDIVLSAMTPAISSFEDLNTMMSLSKKTCIYVSFSTERHSPLMDEILCLLGFENRTKDKFSDTKAYLCSLGYDIKEEFFEHNWTQEGTLEEMTEDVLKHLKMRKIEVSKLKVKELLQPYVVNGKIVRETFSNIGVLVWDRA
ncbi:MAG: class I SAM-dependent DNA methyltransferase [Candidatus Marinarcus sp.]|uniref:class I SAM-dependent DNA methyltransferase n=1 Tax=Candidatus Marinarcus sp. TaxID=3100987 RepID=UPI003B001C03